MKKILITLVLAAAAGSVLAQSTPVGLWKTIDDDGKTEKSLVRISESGGVLSGKIEKISDPAKQDAKCQKCSDERKDKPVQGMTLIRNARADSDKQRCTDCPVSPQGVKDDEEGKEAREAWKMRLGMGLAHGNEEAMLLAISALARLGAAPSHARAHGQHVGARHRHASATRHHLHTTLAAGLDASASVALAGLVIAVSEARVLLRRRLLALRAARGSGCPVV